MYVRNNFGYNQCGLFLSWVRLPPRKICLLCVLLRCMDETEEHGAPQTLPTCLHAHCRIEIPPLPIMVRPQAHPHTAASKGPQLRPNTGDPHLDAGTSEISFKHISCIPRQVSRVLSSHSMHIFSQASEDCFIIIGMKAFWLSLKSLINRSSILTPQHFETSSMWHVFCDALNVLQTSGPRLQHCRILTSKCGHGEIAAH